MSIVGDLVGVAEPLAAVDDEMGRVLACGSVGILGADLDDGVSVLKLLGELGVIHSDGLDEGQNRTKENFIS